jgi:hypothetical protein
MEDRRELPPFHQNNPRFFQYLHFGHFAYPSILINLNCSMNEQAELQDDAGMYPK